MRHYYLLAFFALLHLLGPEAQAQCPVAASCTPGPASNPQATAFGMGIFNVSLGAINNTTLGVTDGYWDYSCQQVAQLAPGATYAISISTNPNSNENVRVWLDYNNDGAFDPVAELFFSSNNARQHSGNSQPVPATAVTGVRLRLRVAADAQSSPIPSPCSTPQYSQTEDYSVLIGVPSQPPVAAFGINAAQACAGTFAFTDQSQQGPTTWRWSFGDGTTSTQASPVHTYAQPGSYSVKLRVCNAFGCDSSTQLVGASWYAPLAVATQCTPATTSYCCSYGITQVEFAGQTQASADAAAGYEDFTCRRQFTAQQNQVLSLRITTGGISRYDARVYIDYNNDGRFSETTELVFEAINTANPSGTIRLAAGGVLNTPLRLRVLAAATGLPLTSCTNLVYGQAEDYSLILSPALCTTVPALAAPVGTTTLCTADTALLVNPTVLGAAIFHQWQTSPDSLAWTNVLGEHGDSLTLPRVTTAAYYRLLAACGSTVQTSPGVRVTPNPSLCYCSSISQVGFCDPQQNRIRRLRISQTTFDYTPPPCLPANPVKYHRVPPYPATQTARLQRGGLYEVHLSSSHGSQVALWVDYNHNGQYETSEFTTVPATSTGEVTVLMQVPAAAMLGATGLRLRNGAFGGSSACMNTFYGDDYDFTITIVPPSCAAPLLNGAVLGPRLFCPRTVPPVSVLGQTIGASLQWQTSPDSLTWTNQAGAQGRLLSGAPLTDSTYVRVQVSCGSTVVYTPAVYLRPDPQLCFCVPPPMAIQCTPYLRRVSLGNTPLDSRGSVCAAPNLLSGYRYFSPDSTANTATLLRGISYPLITNRNSAAPTPFSRVWLDYNHDGHFTDDEVSNLRTDLSVQQSSDDSVATFTVPANAPLGRLRMRILSREYGASVRTSNQCEANGETRDYMLTIAAPDAAPGAPVAGTITGTASLCPGKRLRLTVTGQSYGASLQWEAQAASSTAWQPISGATGTVLLTPFAAATSYRVAATANGSTTYSASHAVAAGACPCTQNLHRFSNCAVPVSGVFLQGRDAYLVTLNQQCSSATPQSYADYSLLSDSVHTTLRRGQTYNVGLLTRLGFANPSMLAGGIWLDYNNNGTFEASEYVATGARANVGVTFNASFTVPATAVLGQIAVRVRTRNDYQSNFNGALACTTFNTGETEDYVVTIAEECPLRAPHILFNGRRADLAPAPGSSVTLSVQTAFPTGTTWRWTGPNDFASTAAQPVLANLGSAHAGYYYLTLQSGSCQLTAARYLNATGPTAAAPARPTGLAATLAPNPSPGRTTLRLTAPAAQIVDLAVLNSLGQTAWQGSARTTAATTEVPLALPQPVPGLYIVRVTTPSGTVYRKWVVE